MFTKEMINDYADKLLFDLTDKEANDLLVEFDAINESMEMIDNIPGIRNVEPLNYPQDSIVCKAYRADNDTRCINTDDALRNSEGAMMDVIEVARVVKDA